MDGHMPSGNEAADVVLEAIEDVLAGTRAWNPSTQPDLFAHLRSIVDSKLSHLVESKANRSIRSEATLSTKDDDEHLTTLVAQFPDSAPSPDQTVLQAEEEQLAEEFFWGFFEYLKDEPLLQKVSECIVDGINKPAEIAARLEVPPKEVYNVRKRLQRRLAEYRAQWAQKPLPRKGGKTHG
jgi:DNA-directed RNA polymerase specialized sigma24 family protein